MKKLLIPFVCLSFALGARGQDVDPAMYYADDTHIYAAVGNLTKFHELADDHAIKELIGHPSLQYIFGGLFEGEFDGADEEFMADIGMEMEDIAKAFPGHVSAGMKLPVDDFLAAITGKRVDEEPEPDIALTAQCTLSEDELAEVLEGIIKNQNRAKKDEDGELVEPEVKFSLIRDRDGGLTVFRFEGESDGELVPPIVSCVLVEGTLVASMAGIKEAGDGLGDGYFADVVERVESEGSLKDALGGSDQYLDVADELRESDFVVFMPLGELAELAEAMVGTLYDEAPEAAVMMAPKDTVLKILGLNELDALTISGAFVDDGIEMFGSINFISRAGAIAKLLNYDGREVSLPDLASEGVVAVSATTLDLAGILEHILDTVKRISPMAGPMVEMQLANMEKEGIPIRKGILGSMAPGSFSLSGYSGDKIPKYGYPSRMISMSLSDPKGLETALDSVRGFMTKMGLPEGGKREFMGVTIHQMDEIVQMMAGVGDLNEDATGSYAIVDDRLVVVAGEDDFMEHIITSMRKKGSDLLDNSAIEAGWERWESKDMVEFAYQDMAALVTEMMTAAVDEFNFYGEEEEAEAFLAGMPDLDDLDFSMIVKTYDSPKSLSFRMAFVRNQ